MDIKDLRRLAKECRKLGISHLKTDEIELNLSSEITPTTRQRRKKSAPVNDSLFEDATPPAEKTGISQHELLFWSSDMAGDL